MQWNQKDHGGIIVVDNLLLKKRDNENDVVKILHMHDKGVIAATMPMHELDHKTGEVKQIGEFEPGSIMFINWAEVEKNWLLIL